MLKNEIILSADYWKNEELKQVEVPLFLYIHLLPL